MAKLVKCKLLSNRKIYCTSFGYITRPELAHILKDPDYEIEFEQDGSKILLSVLMELEPNGTDQELLRRVILAGGFTKYIQQLEDQSRK